LQLLESILSQKDIFNCEDIQYFPNRRHKHDFTSLISFMNYSCGMLLI